MLADTHPCAPASSNTAEARGLTESSSHSVPISALTAVAPTAANETPEQILVSCSDVTVLQRLAVGDFVKICGLKEHDRGTLTHIYDDGYVSINLSVNVSLFMLLQKSVAYFTCQPHYRTRLVDLQAIVPSYHRHPAVGQHAFILKPDQTDEKDNRNEFKGRVAFIRAHNSTLNTFLVDIQGMGEKNVSASRVWYQ